MTAAAIWAALRSPIAQKIGLGIAIVIGALALRAHFVEVGRLKGEATATQRANEFLTGNQEQQRQQTLSVKADNDKQIAELRQEMQSDRAQFTQAIAALASLAKQRDAAAAKVDQVSDSDMHAYNVQQLGLRGAGEKPACYTPAEERSIGKCVADRPLVAASLVQEQAAKQAKEAEAAKADQAAQLEHANTVAVAGYAAQLEAIIVKLRGDLAQPQRKAWCLWLCKRKPEIKIPDPADLVGRPKEILQTSAGRR
jgi:FtsZ-interacting cell division protein ZipA